MKHKNHSFVHGQRLFLLKDIRTTN